MSLNLGGDATFTELRDDELENVSGGTDGTSNTLIIGAVRAPFSIDIGTSENMTVPDIITKLLTGRRKGPASPNGAGWRRRVRHIWNAPGSAFRDHCDSHHKPDFRRRR